ncbi:MAG TPA: hypothetical protein VFF27_09570 [Bacteroidia bacterium]|jgi:hypothetical protein|nr:hypothetical protein [Bacteroidia bacterium]
MKTKTEQQLRKTIRVWLILFMVFLILSGLTAFPLETELKLLVNATGNTPEFLQHWLNKVYEALRETNFNYPFMAYGTDWLAFAHIVIAVAFWGPLKDPVRNIWVIQFGMIACLLIIPLAGICGPVRGIPLYWQLIDCSFGVIGFIPLYICYKQIIELEKLTTNKQILY